MHSSLHSGSVGRARNTSPVRLGITAALRRRGRIALLGIGLLALAACGNNGPDLQAQFAAALPENWQMESFKIDVEEDVGTKVEPQRHYRYRAEVAPKADLFQSVGTLEGYTVLKRTAQKGDKAPVLGTARSIFHADHWESAFSHEQAPDFFSGKPAEIHGAQHVVIGSSDYKRLVASARASLDQRAEQVRTGEAQWQTMVTEWNALNQRIQEEKRQAAETLNREQQRIQREIAALRNQMHQENQAAEQQLQALLKERTIAPKQELDTHIAELDKDHRLKTAELQAQGQEQQQARASQRKALRDAHNADLAAARKRLDAADFTRYRASADETLRAKQAELDTAFRERQTQRREQGTALTNQRREQVAQANDAYQKQLDAIRQELAASRTLTRDGISQNTNAAIETLNAELQKRRQEHQNAIKEHDAQLAGKRRETDQFAAQLQQSRREGAQQEQVLAHLEAVGN